MLKTVALFIGILWIALPCAAQEVEGSGKPGSAIFSNADYLELSTPLTNRVGINTYGFYLGNVRVGIALIEVPVSVQKHFTVTPSYLFVNVPPSGFTLLTGQSLASSYQESQFRLAGTLFTTFHHFTLSERNMYVRRFTPTGDVNRYRNKIYISHPLALGSYKVSPFIFDEVYHDFLPQKWLRRNWIVGGVDMPINRYLTFQPSYIRQDDLFLRSINFLGVGLIIKTDKLFGRARSSAEDSSAGGSAGEATDASAVELGLAGRN
jgi:Protein of unknown function (DUF2490)